jgi:hypothetical protein
MKINDADKPSKTVLADFRFLYALIRFLRRDNSLSASSISPRLRKLSKGYITLVERTVELFLLFDEVEFYCDTDDYDFRSDDGEIQSVLPFALAEAMFQRLPDEIKARNEDDIAWWAQESGIVIRDPLEILVYAVGGDFGFEDPSLKHLGARILHSFANKPPKQRWVPLGCEGSWRLVLEHAVSTNPVLRKIAKPVLEDFLAMYLFAEYTQAIEYAKRPWTREQPKQEMEYLLPLVYPLAYIMRSGILIGSMMSRAGTNGALAISVKGNFPKSNITGATHQVMSLLLDACFEEGLSLPKITTTTDLFRVQQNPALMDFREMFWLWMDSLSKGDNLESRMRQEVAKANRALKKVETCQSIGKWLTYLAIPVALAEILIAIPVISSAMTITSIALDKYGDKLRENASWLSFMLRG